MNIPHLCPACRIPVAKTKQGNIAAHYDKKGRMCLHGDLAPYTITINPGEAQPETSSP